MFIKTGLNGWVPGWPPVQPAGLYSPTSTPYEMARRTESITIEVLLTPTINGKRAVEMKLIDSSDPFFMWQSSISEEDFFVLKREQSLLIDFGRFPYKLIELLQACVSHAREEHPVYSAWLNVNNPDGSGRAGIEAFLSITEATTLRQVPHLSLRLGAVNDTTMRKHLAEMIRQYKDEVDGLRTRLASTAPYTIPTQASTNYPPANSSAAAADYQGLAERCRQLEEKCAMLEASRGGFSTGSAPYSYNRTAPRPVSVSALEAQIAGLEALVHEKTSEIKRLNEILQSERDQAKLSQEKSTKLTEEFATKEAALQQTKEEITKANSIIRKLQDEIRSVKSHLKTSEAFNRQHEKLSRDSRTTIDELRKELADMKLRLDSKSTEFDEVTAAKRKVEAELAELKDNYEAQTKGKTRFHLFC